MEQAPQVLVATRQTAPGLRRRTQSNSEAVRQDKSKPKQIVALVDHSIYAQSFADHVSWLAEDGPAQIEFLHVVGPHDVEVLRTGSSSLAIAGPNMMTSTIALPRERLYKLVADGEELVSSMAKRFAHRTDVEVRGRTYVGEMYEPAVQAAASADLVVLGKRGEHTDFVSRHLGSVLLRVAAQVKTPLLVVPRSFRDIRRWLLAFGDDPHLNSAIQASAHIGLLPSLPCEIVHVGSEEGAVKDAMLDAKRVLDDCQGDATVDFIDGPIVRAIATRAVQKDVGLIAIGGLARTRFLSRLFGEGLAEQLLQACQTPALLLR